MLLLCWSHVLYPKKKKNNYIYDVIIMNGCECKLGKIIYQNNHIKYLHLQVVPYACACNFVIIHKWWYETKLMNENLISYVMIRQELRKQVY